MWSKAFVLMVVAHGIRTNPQIINAVYQSLNAIFLPDSARIVSLPQLGAMFNVHATYQTLLMHNLLEQNAAMHSELPVDNVIALHYVLHTWHAVSNIAIVSGFVLPV